MPKVGTIVPNGVFALIFLFLTALVPDPAVLGASNPHGPGQSVITKRKLLLTAIILASSLLFLNLAVAFLTRNSLPRRVMRHARESRSAGVVALGNSLVASDFDETTFDSAAGLSSPHGAVNLGLGATSPVEHLLLFRYALAHGLRPRLLVYGFYDFQLTDPVQFATGDLIGNHAMLYYIEPFYARHFYSLSVHDAFQFGAMRSFPMLADRGAIWAKVEILRRAMAQQGMPPQRTNRFGRAADFSLLEAASPEDFRRKCQSSMALPLSPAVSELVRQAHNAGISVVVVEMPMRAAHREMFYDTAWWAQYVAHLRALLSPYQVLYVDAGPWVPNDSFFADPLHLSEPGAVQFSRRLGSLLGPDMLPLSAQSAAPAPRRTPQ